MNSTEERFFQAALAEAGMPIGAGLRPVAETSKVLPDLPPHSNVWDEDEALRNELIGTLESRIERRKFFSSNDFWIAQSLVGIAIGGSALASPASVLGWHSPLPAILAAIPAFAIAGESRFKFEQRSFFNNNYKIKCESLLQFVKYRRISLAEAVDALDKLDEEMAILFPRMGDRT